MRSVEQQLALVTDAAVTPEPVRIAIADALGLMCAEEVQATRALPGFPQAAIDGYAVRAVDVGVEKGLGAPVPDPDAPVEPVERSLPVVGEVAAGSQQPLRLQPKQAVRVHTGAPLPALADAVLPLEWTDRGKRRVTAQRVVRSGEFVRRTGDDIQPGDVAVTAGSILGPAQIGLLAAVGRSKVLVYPRPRVFVFASGNELVRVGAPLRPGQIRDSNTLALSAALRAAGAEPIARPDPVADTQTAIEQAIRTGFISADMVISTGGVSMGRRDLIKEVVSGLGEILVGRVAIKPGKPLTYALITGKPFFGLPGFPVSSLVCFEQFVRPVLRILAGHRLLWRPSMRIKLAQTLKHDPDRTEFQRVCVCCSGEGAVAYSTGGQSSGRLKSLVGANGLAVLSAGKGDYDAGEEVEVIFINLPELRE